MDWLVEELKDDSLRMSTEELSTGCASGARPTYGPPSGYSITPPKNMPRVRFNLPTTLLTPK